MPIFDHFLAVFFQSRVCKNGQETFAANSAQLIPQIRLRKLLWVVFLTMTNKPGIAPLTSYSDNVLKNC